jgi:hypothetical protein
VAHTAPPLTCVRRALRVAGLCLALLLIWVNVAQADERDLPIRSAKLAWDDAKNRKLTITVAFRDVLNQELQTKLTRGLPTTILFTAGLYVPGNENAIGTTVQTCRVTWHVWEEAYRVELRRASLPLVTSWTTTLEGVLRRCGETRRLPVAFSAIPRENQPLVLRARVLVNPIGDELMQKIKRWVSRPTNTNTSAPGDALFGTFTGFFMQHIGEAERIVMFGTHPVVPSRDPTGEDRP